MARKLDDSLFTEKDRTLKTRLEQLSRGSLHHMLNNIEQMGVVDTGKSFKYLQYALHTDATGDVGSISFRMHRYTLLQEHGVGRGHPKNGHQSAKEADGKRKERPWFSDALDVQVPKMADEIARIESNRIVKRLYGKNKTYQLGK